MDRILLRCPTHEALKPLSHQIRRNGWYIQIAVPVKLRQRFGKSTLCRTLQTGGLRVARQRRDQALVELRVLFAEVSATPEPWLALGVAADLRTTGSRLHGLSDDRADAHCSRFRPQSKPGADLSAVALKRDPGVSHLAWIDIFKQANLFVTLIVCLYPDAIDFMAPLYPKHNPETPCGWIKRGEDHDARENTRRPRLNVNGTTDLDRLTPVVPFDETHNANPMSPLLGQLVRLNLDAAQGSEHSLADRICVPRRPSVSWPSKVASMALCLCLSLLAAGCSPQLATKAENVAHKPNPMFDAAYSADADIPFVMEPQKAITHGSGRDLFQSESASRRTRDMADWVVSSRDNLNMPFAIIDKVNATVYVFGADGQFYGAAPVLLGLAKGDHSLPGIGKMPMSSIPPSERTTPAGRFVTQMGRDPKGKETLWLDYEGALSMHAVIKGTARDRRAERLASPSALDNRISFGCINVPVPFFHNVIATKFSDTAGIVYILPETKQFGKS